MKMGLNVVFVDCTKMECLEAAITPETKVGERGSADLTCLMSLQNFILALVLGVCTKQRGCRGGLCGDGVGTAGSSTSTLRGAWGRLWCLIEHTFRRAKKKRRRRGKARNSRGNTRVRGGGAPWHWSR